MSIAKKVIFGLILGVIAIPALLALPAINLDADAVINSGVFTYIRAAIYFLPIGTVLSILGLQVAFWVFRIIVSLVKTVWDVLPFA